LRSIGFEKNGLITEKNRRTVQAPARTPLLPGAYVWTMDRKVVYVGSAENLAGRQRSHAARHGHRGLLCQRRLHKAVHANKRVTLYCLAPKKPLIWKGFPFFIYGAVEQRIREDMSPAWNNGSFAVLLPKFEGPPTRTPALRRARRRGQGGR